MTGAPQDGDRGRRVVQLRELLAATGPGVPDRVADLAAAARAAEGHPVADLAGADLAGIDPASSTGPAGTDDGGTDAAGTGPAGTGPARADFARTDFAGSDSAGSDPVGSDPVGSGGECSDGAGTGGGNRAAAVAALDGLAGAERDAAPVAGLDGAGLGGAAAAARTVDLGAAGARKPRRAPGADDPTDHERRGSTGRKRPTDRSAGAARFDEASEERPGGDGQDRSRRGSGRRSVSGRWSGSRRAAESESGPAADLDRGNPAEPGAAGGPARSRRGSRSAGAERAGAGAIAPDVDPVAAAREICLLLLADRARTRHELAQALRRKDIPDDAAEQVLGRFDEVGLIDDAAFAGQWVRSRHRSRGLGRRAIAQELRRKGVDEEVAGEALAEVDGEAEELRARQLVDRKLRSMKLGSAEDRTAAVRRLVGMLARRGYGGGLAYGVVRTALAEHGADTEEFDGGEPVD